MRVVSLFSGIGGFDLALERAGMEVIAQVEIDPYCRKVLARHWPEVPRYEDVRSVGLGRAEHHVEGQPDDAQGGESVVTWGAGDVDLICGGFPCQDVSVAGKRAGLDGARSGLWFEFQRIVSELRPAYVLVENVPGLLSSHGGRDFAVLLNGLGELGYAVSWAVLDAQHFGVPQRRRRVFVVAGPDPGRTEAILALSEGCGGHPETGRAPGQDLAATLGEGLAKSLRAQPNASHRADSDTYIPEIAHPINARDAKGVNQREDVMTYLAVRTAQTGANGIGVAEDVTHTLDGASQAVMTQAVRRLTPVECERLQGFPDNWTDGADGPRYRALGNAVAVPVVEWIGRRIMAVEP